MLEDKGKEATTLPEAEGKEVALKVKGTDSKAKDDAAKAKDDPPVAKAFRILSNEKTSLFTLCIFTLCVSNFNKVASSSRLLLFF